MDWFERLTGFRETSYEHTRANLELTGATLRSRVNGRAFATGDLDLPSLQSLRGRVAAGAGPAALR
jgi:hypothetical protein